MCKKVRHGQQTPESIGNRFSSSRDFQLVEWPPWPGGEGGWGGGSHVLDGTDV